MKTSTNFLSKTLIFTFVIFAFSCSSHRKTQPLKITILLDQSYQYDLLNGVYSVFYTNKAPTVIKFHLTDKERKEISDKYYSLKLDEIKQTDSSKDSIYRIKDKCSEMPANRTILQVQKEDQEQKIQINLDCSSFYLSNFAEAKRVKKFLLFIFKIVRSKSQIKSAPISDILYM